MKCIDALAARIAVGQHGLVAYEQLRQVGACRQEIRTRLDRKQWAEVDPAVIGIVGAPLTPERKLLTAVLAAGRGAVASHRCAAWLWGIEGIRADAPEITIPRGRRFRRPDVVVHQSTDLDRTTATAIRGIPTTQVARTLVDLGAVVPLRKVRLAVDFGRRNRLTTWDVLLNTLVVHARRGRDGVGSLRRILDDHYGEIAVTGSGFERLVLIALGEAGLPSPVLQHEVHIAGQRYRIDLAYPDEHLAIELDGRIHLAEEVWQSDHRRQNALVNAGWTVLRFTWRDYSERRSEMIREIRTALARN